MSRLQVDITIGNIPEEKYETYCSRVEDFIREDLDENLTVSLGIGEEDEDSMQ